MLSNVLTFCTAVAFGYFEALIHHGDTDRFGMEEARLRSMSNIMVQAGFDEMLIEDFAEETIGLLRKVGDAIPLGTAEDVLDETFNDQMTQDYIITYIRVRRSAFAMPIEHAANTFSRPSPLLG